MTFREQMEQEIDRKTLEFLNSEELAIEIGWMVKKSIAVKVWTDEYLKEVIYREKCHRIAPAQKWDGLKSEHLRRALKTALFEFIKIIKARREEY